MRAFQLNMHNVLKSDFKIFCFSVSYFDTCIFSYFLKQIW